MKNTVVIVIAIFILLFFSYSSIQAKEIDATTTQLRKAAQIWGFLKYYHPVVAEGKYNWDKELIDILGKLNRNFSEKKTDQIFFDWIQRLGAVPLCTTCREESDLEIFDKNFDLKWLQSFDQDLSDKLENIRKNRFQGDHAYFTQSEENFVINFINEPEYDQDLWKDPNLRLLTLFRYWNYIEYFFPHKYLLETSWTSTLDALIPRYLEVKNETAFHLLLLETLTLIEDSHAFFKSDLTKEYFGKKSPPFRVKFIDNSAVVAEIYNDSLCNIDDIKLGDIITKVNSISLENLLNEKLKFVPGSNRFSKLRDAKSVVFNGSADTLKVSFRRGESLLSKYIKRYDLTLIDFDEKNIQSWEIMDNNVGYVNMGLLTQDMIDTMMNSFADTKGIIFDLRNYPNGTFNTLCGYLNTEPKPFTKIAISDVTYPGRFICLPFMMNCGIENGKVYENPIVILVNELTQSQAEFTAMAFSTVKNSLVVGSQTTGADGNANKFELPGGFPTMFTGIGIFYPDGTQTQRIGIKLDKEIHQTAEQIRNGEDPLMEYGLNYILKY